MVVAEGTSATAAVAIDGKTLRGSVEPRGSPDFYAFNDRKAAHVLSAFAADDQINLGHPAIMEKSDEIAAAEVTIATLGPTNRVLTSPLRPLP